MRITNVGGKVLILHQDLRIGIWLAGDNVPRLPGFISVGSRRYMEWQNLALKATVDLRSADSDPDVEDPPWPAVERPEYETPRGILQRQRPTVIKCLKGGSNASGITRADMSPVEDPAVKTVLADDALSEGTGADQDPPVQEVQDPRVATLKGDGPYPSSLMGVESGTSHRLGDPLDQKDATDEDPAAVLEDQPNISDLDLTWDSDQDYDECVYYHEGSDLYAEDVDGQLAVLPEVPAITEDVKIEDIQLCGSDDQTPEEIDRLRQRIWKFRHLLIGKGNALPPTARGVVCDINVGGARPIARKCRKLPERNWQS
ncbi:reverse transcriptase [Phytophthora megakarya]|uniref:Reverse transcriptase n=1 Tax=Phytophthora megakarya TaxID=4795 RepID=A0A225UDR7_9STRA|nr:reverse transcriptase [Phytophthora megakarya]